jgi:predicted DNA-binding transcriptional regulator AlpA
MFTIEVYRQDTFMIFKKEKIMEVDAKPSLADDKLLRIDDVVELTTLSKSCINLWVAQGKFTRPITLSPTVKVWRLKDIRDWVNARKGEQA